MTEVAATTRYLLEGPFREEVPFWQALAAGRFELPGCRGEEISPRNAAS
jgi:hypothetical protein